MIKLFDQLKKYRKKYGLTQENLAELCGVTRQAVAKWESGDGLPSLDNLLQLASYFHVSLETLLTGTEASAVSEPAPADVTQNANEKLINKGLRQAMNCDEPNEEIQVFIGYIGQMLNCDRTYIFEQDPKGEFCNTYEWCNHGVEPQINSLQGIPVSNLALWEESFQRGENIFIEDLETIKNQDPAIYAWLAPQHIHSLIAIPLFGGKGFFGVDNPAMAFASQTETLMELNVHFVESMLQRRDLVQRLLIETDQTITMDNTAHRTRYYINVQTGSIVINAEVFRSLGYCLEIHSMTDLEKLLARHPECRSHVMDDGLKRVEETREATTIEFVFYTYDHLIRWMRLSIRPFLDSRGNLLQLHGTLQDISDEHEVIDRYNAFTSHLRGGMHICYLSAPCHLYYASDNLCELVGYTRQDFDRIVGTSYDSLIVDEDLPAFKGFVKRLTENPGTEETCEYRLKHRDGSVVRVIDTMESVMDGNGIVYGYANVMDVSEMRRTLDIAEKNELSELAELDRQFEIVDALSRDYYNIFLINLERGEAVIHKLNGYVTRGMDRRSSEPIPYYDFCRRYVEERVYPDDHEMMLQALHPDTVLQKLMDSREYSSPYRILDNGQLRYCQFKFILPDDCEQNRERPSEVIAAFRSIDEIVRKENERMKAMRLRMDIINACLKIYLVGYYVDLQADTVTELEFGQENISTPQNIEQFLRSSSVRFSGARDEMYQILSPQTIQKKLENRDYLCEQFSDSNGIWYEASEIVRCRNAERQVQQYFIMVRDISSEKELECRQANEILRSHRREQEMEQAAYRDALTGVMNRNAYQCACEEVEKSPMVGIVYCDVNGLKYSNDTYGHSAGDQLLCRFAEMLKQHFSKDCIFRIGGDEFICMISGIEKEKFQARVEALTAYICENGSIAAAGYAYGSGSERGTLVSKAEKMMYDRKTEQKLK